MGNLWVHPLVREIAEIFERSGRQAYLVGGAVRDLLRGVAAKDWDLATDAPPEEVMRLFRRVIPTGIKHGTVTIRYKGLSVETTTFRTEAGYADGRRPDRVSYAATIEEDLSRRDFTMNAVALSLPSLAVVDPYGGEADIRGRIIRCVGDPAERFSEDGLRPLRGVRFAAQLGFLMDGATQAAIRPALPVAAKVSAERVRDELDRILASRLPSVAFRLMEDTGLLELFLPELARCRGVDQKGFHRYDVLDHSLLSCDAAPADRPLVRLAALLHDLGKPLVRRMDESGVWTFHRHEEEGARIAREILSRLRYPTAVIEGTAHLVGVHMFHYEPSWSDAAVRRFVVRVGEGNLADLYALRRADAWGTSGAEPPASFNLDISERVEAVLERGRALSIKDLAVGGEDLAALGVPRGPRMGTILKELFETVLEDPDSNERETLLTIARRLNERYGGPGI